jgi:hypothetical protein
MENRGIQIKIKSTNSVLNQERKCLMDYKLITLFMVRRHNDIYILS